MRSYSSRVGRWGVWAFAAACVVFGTSACDHGAPDADAPPGGVRLSLDRCELRAPGQWVVDGRVILPAEAHEVHATLAFSFGNGDVSQASWTDRVTFTDSGRFAVAITSPTVNRNEPADDGFSDCNALIWSATVPVATPGSSAKPSATPTPYTYSAPRDSIQALGIGARLDRPEDPRTVSLYSAWAGVRSSIKTVYVPHLAGFRPTFAFVQVLQSSCEQIDMRIGPVAVSLTTLRNLAVHSLRGKA